MCAHFQSNPKESHLTTVKRILRYLKGTHNLGLWYSKSDSCHLYGYTNIDYTISKTDKKSTSGACHFLGHYLVSWHSKKTKENSVALFIVEAKYVVARCCCAQLCWMK